MLEKMTKSKYLLFLVVGLVLIAVISWNIIQYLEKRNFLVTFSDAVKVAKENGEITTSLKHAIDALIEQNKDLYFIEEEYGSGVKIGSIKLGSGNFVFVVYCEHHSNQPGINRVALIQNGDLYGEYQKHLCTGFSFLSYRTRPQDINDLAVALQER